MEPFIKSEITLAGYIISFLIGFPANLLALHAFRSKRHSKPLPIDILLLNQTISNLLFLVILPLKMHEAASDMIWTLPHIVCSFASFIFFSSIDTSTLFLTAVSSVRYIAIVHPVSYHRLQKPVYAMVISIVIWLISAAHCSIIFIVEHHPSLSNKNSSRCYNDFTEKQQAVLLPVRFEIFIVLCILPLAICIYCYMHCVIIVCIRPRISKMQKQKAIGMALGTLAVFLICVLPFNISHLWGYTQGKNPWWRYYTLLLCTFNTCIDPVIFYFSSSAFRCTSRKLILKLFGHSVSQQQRQYTNSG